jgi:hypothetical protein
VPLCPRLRLFLLPRLPLSPRCPLPQARASRRRTRFPSSLPTTRCPLLQGCTFPARGSCLDCRFSGRWLSPRLPRPLAAGLSGRAFLLRSKVGSDFAAHSSLPTLRCPLFAAHFIRSMSSSPHFLARLRLPALAIGLGPPALGLVVPDPLAATSPGFRLPALAACPLSPPARSRCPARFSLPSSILAFAVYPFRPAPSQRLAATASGPHLRSVSLLPLQARTSAASRRQPLQAGTSAASRRPTPGPDLLGPSPPTSGPHLLDSTSPTPSLYLPSRPPCSCLLSLREPVPAR